MNYLHQGAIEVAGCAVLQGKKVFVVDRTEQSLNKSLLDSPDFVEYT